MTSVTLLHRSAARVAAVLASAGLTVAGAALPATATAAHTAVLVPGGHGRSRADYGHTGAPDGRLRAGCHDYPYRYVVTPPTSDWTLETFLVDRTGDGVGSGAYFSDSDPRRQRAHFRLCRASVHAGRFTIRAKLHWYAGDGTDHLVWLPRSHFRLRR